ncbi:MAG: hypothetical protein MI754_02745, partial [Chromatiales bacterium]|nr:hypothetical protein [Chromatiales bacterium]
MNRYPTAAPCTPDNGDAQPMWSPTQDQIESTRLHRFMADASALKGVQFNSYEALWQWSVEDIESFWSLVWDFSGVVGDKGTSTVSNLDQMPGARWFPGSKVNYAENLLKTRDDSDALVFWGEDKVKRRL